MKLKVKPNVHLLLRKSTLHQLWKNIFYRFYHKNKSFHLLKQTRLRNSFPRHFSPSQTKFYKHLRHDHVTFDIFSSSSQWNSTKNWIKTLAATRWASLVHREVRKRRHKHSSHLKSMIKFSHSRSSSWLKISFSDFILISLRHFFFFSSSCIKSSRYQLCFP